MQSADIKCQTVIDFSSFNGEGKKKKKKRISLSASVGLTWSVLADRKLSQQKSFSHLGPRCLASSQPWTINAPSIQLPSANAGRAKSD